LHIVKRKKCFIVCPSVPDYVLHTCRDYVYIFEMISSSEGLIGVFTPKDVLNPELFVSKGFANEHVSLLKVADKPPCVLPQGYSPGMNRREVKLHPLAIVS